MDVQIQEQSQEAILQRIDTVIRELEELRRIVMLQQAEQSSDDLAQRLYGALGQGTWEEYDPDINWKRFEV